MTGTRAEYGLLKHLMRAIKNSDEFELQIIATGMHLSKKYGLTYQEIEADGFLINRAIDIQLDTDTSLAISKSLSIGLKSYAEMYQEIEPDLVLILGDRFEIFAAAIAALFCRIPIAHLHGGELSEGSMDDSIRHAVTKLSHLHFVATDEYRNRVIQLGENPSRVFNVGGLGVDAITKVKLLDRAQLEDNLGFKFKDKNLLITYHSPTLEKHASATELRELLAALSTLVDTQLIFTMPNADVDNEIIFSMIEEFVKNHPNACYFTSLGQLRYLSCMAQVDAVVGNSSSGLTEAPSFKKATVNIGHRQKGRVQAKSIIDCEADSLKITAALQKVYDEGFQASVHDLKNPYGDGGASEQITSILKSISFDNLIKKEFYDL